MTVTTLSMKVQSIPVPFTETLMEMATVPPLAPSPAHNPTDMCPTTGIATMEALALIQVLQNNATCLTTIAMASLMKTPAVESQFAVGTMRAMVTTSTLSHLAKTQALAITLKATVRFISTKTLRLACPDCIDAETMGWLGGS